MIPSNYNKGKVIQYDMLGYKVYYDKKSNCFCSESETSEVDYSNYNKDTDVSWFDTLAHAVNSTNEQNERLKSKKLTVKECKDCQRIFCIDHNELEWLKERHLKPYIRCYDCRQKRRCSTRL